MSVFGSQNERVAPAPAQDRRPLASEFTYSPQTQPHAPPRATAEPQQHPKASVLGKTLVFRGELEADEDLVLQGRVEGSIRHTRSITIGIDGVVVGDIYAASVTVEGTVEGNLHGSASVLIGASAKVKGNIASPRVGITEGAQFNGSVDMSSARAASGASPHAQRATGSTDAPVMSDSVVDRMLQSS